ncbi:hypothetical protein CWRG_01131 [Chthonomonas calidirosea]|nr:hypothetical protein CWRG_01131 [Chthonomonas calidirosea]
MRRVYGQAVFRWFGGGAYGLPGLFANEERLISATQSWEFAVLFYRMRGLPEIEEEKGDGVVGSVNYHAHP